jgi:hypothetical protein
MLTVVFRVAVSRRRFFGKKDSFTITGESPTIPRRTSKEFTVMENIPITSIIIIIMNILILRIISLYLCKDTVDSVSRQCDSAVNSGE